MPHRMKILRQNSLKKHSAMESCQIIESYVKIWLSTVINKCISCKKNIWYLQGSLCFDGQGVGSGDQHARLMTSFQRNSVPSQGRQGELLLLSLPPFSSFCIPQFTNSYYYVH